MFIILNASNISVRTERRPPPTRHYRLKERAQDKREARVKAAASKSKETQNADEKVISMPVEYNSDRPSVHIPEVSLF